MIIHFSSLTEARECVSDKLLSLILNAIETCRFRYGSRVKYRKKHSKIQKIDGELSDEHWIL